MTQNIDVIFEYPEVVNFHFYKNVRKIRIKKGCWIWTGAKLVRGGYGNFVCRPIGIYPGLKAHRVAYMLENQVRLTPQDHILHKCDNPLCVNPSHLYIGTQKDNMKDMVKRGRSAKGSDHSQAKLTEEDVYAIREDMRKQKDIATDYGISVPTVSDIKNRRSWSHI